MSEILVFCRVIDGRPTRNSFEGIGAGRKLADSVGMTVGAIVTYKPGEEKALQDLIACGAETVYAATVEDSEGFYSEVGLSAAEKICRECNPKYILLVADTDGREIGPRLACRLNAGIVSECIDIQLNDTDKSVYALKPVYGGKAIAKIKARDFQVFTLREHVFEGLEKDEKRQGEVKTYELKLTSPNQYIRQIEFIEEEHAGIKLEDADIVISGGRGLGGKEQFQIIEDLSKILSGAPAASRAAVDAGWAPASYQVGQTGKIIAPNLYIAIGISGASQHIAGISGSKCIVAINKDPDAPIFRAAQYGIVEEYQKVIPLLRERITEMIS